MSMQDQRRVLEIIDHLTETRDEISSQEIEERASQEGIEQPRRVLDSLMEQGLITEQDGLVSKIVKRLFW